MPVSCASRVMPHEDGSGRQINRWRQGVPCACDPGVGMGGPPGGKEKGWEPGAGQVGQTEGHWVFPAQNRGRHPLCY